MACHDHLNSSSLSLSSYFHLGDHRQHHFLFLGISSFIEGKFSFGFFNFFRERVGEWKICSLRFAGRFRTGDVFSKVSSSCHFKSKAFSRCWSQFKTCFLSVHFILFKFPGNFHLHKTPQQVITSLHSFQMHLLKLFSPKNIKFTKRETFLPRD